jgi:hypothetical protein
MKKTIPLPIRVCLFVVFLGLVLLNRQAYAGSWEVSYEAKGIDSGKGGMAQIVDEYGPRDDLYVEHDAELVHPWTPGPISRSIHGYTIPRWWEAFTPDEPYRGTSVVHRSGSVTATLSWQPYFEGELPPAKIYVYEFGGASSVYELAAVGAVSVQYDLDNGFNDILLQHTGPFSYMVGDNDGAYSKEGYHLLTIDNSNRAAKVTLPTRHLKAFVRIEDQDYTEEEPLHPYYGSFCSVSLDYFAFPLAISLNVYPTAGSTQSVVAAGAKDSAEHKSKFRIEMWAQNFWTPVPYFANFSSEYPPKLPLPPLEELLINPTRDGALIEVEKQTTTNETGINSSAEIIGTIRSSNILQNRIFRIEPDAFSGQYTIHQNWSDEQNLSRWSYDPYASPSATGSGTAVTYKPLLKGAAQVPITGHRMKFLVTEAKVWEWNEDAQEYELKTRSDPNGVDLGELASFDTPEVEDSGNGTYTANLQLHPHEDKMVDSLKFQVEDQDVYTSIEE